jgi:aliphatic nitrilase
MAQKFIAAAAQIAPVFLDRDASTEKACNTIADAGKSGARLIVFPETYLPGYPYWNLVRDPFTNKRTFFRRLFDQAVTADSPTIKRLCEAAGKAKCMAVIGINEKEGGTLYNSQLIIGADGSVVGCRRKLVPTHHERMTWGRGDGVDLDTYDTPLGKLGALICFEHSNALYRYALQAQGEQIHVANWPGGMPWIDNVIDAATRHYAFEGQCFVISTTGVLTQEVLDEFGQDAVGKLRPGGGCSAIIAPGGKILAKPETDGETVLFAELDFESITDMKEMVDSIGHYARPDIAQLHITRTKRSPLVIREA